MVGLVAPFSSEAHHSSIGFDRDQVIAFEGILVQFDWTNPHVYLTVEDSSGVEWLIQTDATPIMSRSGWASDSFSPGDEVIVRANPDRNSERAHAWLLSVQGPDGVTLASSNRSGEAIFSDVTAVATSLAGIWRGERFRGIFGMLRNHPLTEKGEVARAEYDESMNPVIDCVSWPSPWILAANALYLSELELHENSIVFRNEFHNTQRTIYMDGREHPEDGERTNQGHSIGWWEDDTLVVDTRLFADHRSPFPSLGIPSGAQKHVTERYTLSQEGTQVLIDVLLEDPEYLAEPYTTQLVWHYSPHLEMLTLDCDPGVSRRFIPQGLE